ncbi:amidohydrolase [Amycolatopsis sp. NBC_01480]|uniref:amidohydrolase n=1 Tax=Amycolatopsis sp. NBC_01480 TaxID=2903562 RepID=UPI002E293EE8|nr:amidohydrolase [Amycolatopsis sp. NBC_01480]
MSTTRVFRGGRVFTADAAGTVASAVAVAGGRIVAVGGDHTVAPYLHEAEEVVELDGRLLLPGFGDAHVHPVMGGLERIRCDLSGATTVAAYVEIIGDYARRHPGREWILGGGWAMEAFPGGRPHREVLDAVAGDRPVLLPNRDHHSSWASSAALARAGITRGTPDPADGRIERDADGEPTGLLHEGAADLVRAVAPEDTQEDLDAALAEAQRHLHAHGITSWQDALLTVHEPGPSAHESYRRADLDGRLTARVAGALWWDRSCPRSQVAEQVARLAAIRAATDGRNYRTGTVKVMQDGVVETFTAAMLEPYLDCCGGATGNHGISFLEPDLLREVTIALDATGFQVHYHAIGDRAVREVLDAIEAAIAANGASARRHHLAHLQVVHPDDVPRFHRLGVTANLQALWAAHEPQMDELTLPFLGDPRAGWQYPFGDLLRTGAALAMGSDWPVSSPDPLAAVHVAVTRVAPDAPAGTPALGPEQAIPLATALRAYTAGSAAVNHLDHVTGSISVGKAADLVLLDRDPFDGPAEQIAAARVARTYADGVEVHRS